MTGTKKPLPSRLDRVNGESCPSIAELMHCGLSDAEVRTELERVVPEACIDDEIERARRTWLGESRRMRAHAKQ